MYFVIQSTFSVSNYGIVEKPIKYNNTFPLAFFIGVIFTVVLTVSIAQFGYEVLPRNSFSDCKKQFINTKNESAGFKFCDCIHNNGKPLDDCLEEFEKAKK